MTAEKIREVYREAIARRNGLSGIIEEMLAEIAAQLAEHNAIQRETLQLAKDARAQQEKLAKLLQGAK